MTNEDNNADPTRVSDWTLATGTKPGARELYSPTATAKRGPWPALKEGTRV
jgi:hypothetical protein